MKRVEHRVRQSCSAEIVLNARVREQIDRATEAQVRKALGTHADCLPLIDDCYPVVHGSIRDGGGFTVIKRQGCGSDDESFEMLGGGIIERYDVDEACSHEIIQEICIWPPPAAAERKLAKYDVHDGQTIGQSRDDLPGATCRVQVNDRAGIGDQEGAGISHAG
jgi:hypothetical protein